MSSRTFARQSWLPLLLIGLGLAWLLGTLDLFSSASGRILLTYWPLLLVGLGLDYLLGRNRELDVSYSVLAIGVLVLLMLVGPLVGMGQGPQATDEQFREPLGNTERADVSLDLGVVPTTVRPLTGSEWLIDADLRDPGQVDVTVRGGRDKEVTVARSGNVSVSGSDARWIIGLTPQVPLALEVDGGAGPVDLDLSTLRLSEFEIDAGAGSFRLVLPGSSERYQGEIDAGAGPLDISVRQGAGLELDLGAGNGPLELGLEPDVDLELDFDTSNGPVDIRFAAGSAVRLEIDDDGPGMVSIGGGLERVRGSGDTGVWQTSGFGDAERQIVIEIDDVGAGPISVR